MHPDDWRLVLKMICLMGLEEEIQEDGNVTRTIYFGSAKDLIPNVSVEARAKKKTISDNIKLNSTQLYFLRLIRFDYLGLKDIEETESVRRMTIPEISSYLESRFGKVIQPNFITECKSRYFESKDKDIIVKADYNTTFFILNNLKEVKPDLTEKSVRITITTSHKEDGGLFAKIINLLETHEAILTMSKRKAGNDLIETLFS